MAGKFLDFNGLSYFKNLMVEYITQAIEALATTIQSTYSTKTEVEEVDAELQGVLEAFKQFNTENGIQ